MARRAARSAARLPAGRAALRLSTQTGAVPRHVWADLQFPQHYRVRVGRRFFRYEASPGDRVSAPLYWTGLASWEAETFSAFVPLATASRGFIDVGAYTGVFTLVAATANPELSAVSFEPNPQRFHTLVRNLERNGLTGRCKPLPVALGSSSGRARLFVPAHDDSMASLDPDTDVGDGTRVEVEVAAPDSVIPPELSVDLIKIDVEGREEDVLLALEPRLTRDRPALICEFLGCGPYDEAEAIFDRLGYERWHLSPRGPVRVSHLGGKPTPFHNFLCLPAQ
jgi:FkbM family methyltransferase